MIDASSVPVGVSVELSRARILSGKGAVVDEWMRMLNELTPQLFLAPEHIRNTMVAWATEGTVS